MPQPQKQPDPQALKRLLTEYVTISGRKLGAASRETLEWLVREAGFRRTFVRLSGNEFRIDPSSMTTRLRRLEADGALVIYRIHAGRLGGAEVRVRDLFAIHAYRQAERDRDKWLLQFSADDDEPPATITLSGVRNSGALRENSGASAARVRNLFGDQPLDSEESPDFSRQESGISSRKFRRVARKLRRVGGKSPEFPRVNSGALRENSGASAARVRNFSETGAPPELEAKLRETLTANQLESWLLPSRFVVTEANTQVFLFSAFAIDLVRKNIGRQMHAATRDAGLPPLEFCVDGTLRAWFENDQNSGASAARVRNFPVNELIFNQTRAARRGDFGEHPLLRAAESLYDAVGLDWPFRWFAIQAITLLDAGAIQRADIEQRIADPARRAKLLPHGIRELAGEHWRELPAFRRHLSDHYGIAWQEHFAANRAPRANHPRKGSTR